MRRKAFQSVHGEGMTLCCGKTSLTQGHRVSSRQVFCRRVACVQWRN
ncbi:Bgt-20839 [Blumeria graminis f. sp. tritici]|uniref:Bgt-20839 n=2 Tax=Blumeria graminis f. sp. tritici TaxID=62690 RepID=A0A9X9LAE8_BLUGR|nr:Bgt-20839 [Blumeria graminis f. sp. tritici]